MNDDFKNDYNELFSRQIKIPQIGDKGQEKIKNAHIAIIGAGGLGSFVITELCSAGIGKITIFDNDVISLSNLNRQFLYTIDDISKSKISVLNEKLHKSFPHTRFVLDNSYIDSSNIEEKIKNVDIIILCVDSIKTRLCVNEYAIKNNIKLIDGGIKSFYGYVMLVEKNTACINCINLNITETEEKISAISSSAGIIASIQVSICVMLILEIENPYKNMILQYDGILGEFEKIPLNINPNCHLHD